MRTVSSHVGGLAVTRLDMLPSDHILCTITQIFIEGVIMSKIAIIREFWLFLRVRKKWWLIPIVVSLLLLGVLLLFAESSAVAPFIYTLF